MQLIPLFKDKKVFTWTKVDDEDFYVLSNHRWRYEDGYAIRGRLTKRGFKTISIHRFLLRPHRSRLCDHIDGDKLNNQRSNLRVATRCQNAHNSKARSHSKQPYKGVRLMCGNWQARIRYHNKEIHLGTFSSPELARDAYHLAAKKYHGEFARLA